jgi:hypothetical protein
MRFGKTFFICLLLNYSVLHALPTEKQSREEYIAHYADDAVREMKKSGIPASITLAQACLESSDGNSPLAVEANNHFGIKCANWPGPGYYQDDDAPNECFRKYSSAFESFDDHSNFLKSRPRYASLFELDPTDYRGWAHGLKKAGYATDPNYADRLIKIIEDYNLHRYDTGNESAVAYASATGRALPHSQHSFKKIVEVPSAAPVDIYTERKVMTINGASYILARSGDNFKKLSEELHLGYWQLPKYNELPGDANLTAGQVVYITPKKRNAEVKNYIVKEGDDLHAIAQQLGIKSKFIRKYNGLSENQTLTPGMNLMVSK